MDDISSTPPINPTALPPGTPPTATTSTMTVISLILAILSLTCCGFIAGIPAFIIGRSEMKAAQEKRIHESNFTMAKIAMILGIVGTALSCLGTLVYIAIIALGVLSGMAQH
ncbi:hypothetical protein K1X76_00815 [bacterium]|nr:hypothetical protein [bacterium]